MEERDFFTESTEQRTHTLVCPKCGQKVSRLAKFCAQCGESSGGLFRLCKTCGKAIRAASKFCSGCDKPQP